MSKKPFEYDEAATWEYNLDQFARWSSPEDAKADVAYFIRTYLPNIVREDPELLPPRGSATTALVTEFSQIQDGQPLLVFGNRDGVRQHLFSNVSTKQSLSDGQEVILQKKGNIYFNFRMYLSGDSWVKQCYRFL